MKATHFDSQALFSRHQRITRPLIIAGLALSLMVFGFAILIIRPAVALSPQDAPPIEVLSYEDETCYALRWQASEENPTENWYQTANIAISIPYTGVIEEATLLLRSTNVRAGEASRHPIYINGIDTGYAPSPDDYHTCNNLDPNAIIQYPLDLNKVAITPGVNIVTLTAADTTDNWGADYVAIRVRGHDIKGGYFESIIFPGENGQDVNAELLLPYDYNTRPRPLLVLFHGWRGAPIDPYFTDYTPAALEQGWIVVSPQQRGQNALGSGGQPLASLRSQHDAIKLVAYMESHYQIDPERIYVGGFSMGGMMAGMMAAKYPDTFAAAVTHMAITDLRDWYYEVSDYRQSQIVTETGGTPQEIPFEYDRRSPKELASNLKNTPIAIVHGISDTVVPPQQAQDFYDAIALSTPVSEELHWYQGDHNPAETPPFGGAWAVNFMKNYHLNANPTSLRIHTDESKPYYWLIITSPKTTWRTFTQVDADVDADHEQISVTVNDNYPVGLRFDLARVGLDDRVSYVISQTNDATGSSIQAVTPLDGKLNVTAPVGETRLDIFPNRGNMPVEMFLQRGKDGYQGVADAWIDQWGPDSNHGNDNIISLRPNGVQRGLIKFDLDGMLPDHIRITSADLYLYDNGNGPDMTLNFYPLTRSWDENSVTYNQAAGGQPWATAGGDYDPHSVASLTLNGSSAGYVNFSLLDAVRAWVADPSSNHGLLLDVTQSNYSGSRSVQASEFWDQNQRPELKIIYEPIPPTPTPTLGSVSGVVYEDVNRNRQYDAGEPLLAGATVALQQNGATIAQQMIGGDGAFHFNQLSSGSYQLRETPPPGYAAAQPTGNVFFTISGGDNLIFNFAHDPRLYLPIITR